MKGTAGGSQERTDWSIFRAAMLPWMHGLSREVLQAWMFEIPLTYTFQRSRPSHIPKVPRYLAGSVGIRPPSLTVERYGYLVHIQSTYKYT